MARRGRAGGRAAAGHGGGLRREAERMWELDSVADGGSLRRRVPAGGRAAAPEGKEAVPRGSGGRHSLKEEAAVGLGDESRKETRRGRMDKRRGGKKEKGKEKEKEREKKEKKEKKKKKRKRKRAI